MNPPVSPIITDVAIVGAGPSGLFSAFQCRMLELDCVIADVLEHVGGQCATLYPEKPIYDIPGFPSITGRDLSDRLAEQIVPFKIPMLLGDQILQVEGCRGDFTLVTSRGKTIRAKAVIIAGGAGSFGPNRPPLAGIEAYEAGKTVHYYVQNAELFTDRSLVIAGGGDSALDWALHLAPKARHIYLVHRREKFRAAPETLRRMEEQVRAGRIEKIIPYQLDSLHGQNGILQNVRVKTLQGESRDLPAHHLLAFFGLNSALGPIESWALNPARGTISVQPATMETCRPGIFAVGDIASYPGKLKLILQGFSEAAMAAHAAFSAVKPDTALHFQHSTSRNAPGN